MDLPPQRLPGDCMLKAVWFRLVRFLPVMLLLTGLLRVVPSNGSQAQTIFPPVSVHLPLILGQTGTVFPTLLAADQPHPNGLVVDSQNIYWTNCGASLSSSPDGS